MRMKRKHDDIELPEKTSPTTYINVRSAERIDVRPNETVTIQTGVLVAMAAGETAHTKGKNVRPTSIGPKGYKDLLVMMTNRGERNLLIYPGQVIARIDITKKKVEARKRKRKKVTLYTEAKFLEE